MLDSTAVEPNQSRHEKLKILLTNDDGVEAKGLKTLLRRLSKRHEVCVVAPAVERSACGHGISLHVPLRLKKRGRGIYSVDGTPTDCINLGVFEVLKRKPDLVISGINQGPNMGTDTLYSGTVAGAIEGAILGINSIAVSLASYQYSDFGPAAEFTENLVARLGGFKFPADVCLNVNIPPSARGPVFETRLTALGRRRYSKIIREGVDPRGKKYYWIGGEPVEMDKRDCCDSATVEAGFISITPMKLDMTATGLEKALSKVFDGKGTRKGLRLVS
jgi:5'-nucleotidase